MSQSLKSILQTARLQIYFNNVHRNLTIVQIFKYFHFKISVIFNLHALLSTYRNMHTHKKHIFWSCFPRSFLLYRVYVYHLYHLCTNVCVSECACVCLYVCVQRSMCMRQKLCACASSINQWAVSFSSQWAAELTEVVVRDTVTFTAQRLTETPCCTLQSVIISEPCWSAVQQKGVENVEREQWYERHFGGLWFGWKDNGQMMLGMKRLTRRADWLQRMVDVRLC